MRTTGLLHDLTLRAVRRLVGASLLIGLAFASTLSLGPSLAVAATPAPAWEVHSFAEPTNFSSSDNPECEAEPNGRESASTPCASYRIVVRNAGSVASSGPVTVSDVVPSELTVVDVSAEEQQAGQFLPQAADCSNPPFTLQVTCTHSTPVAPDGVIVMAIHVVVAPGAPRTVTNSARVEGGGGAAVATTEPTTRPNTVNSAQPASFSITDFSLTANGPDGRTETQAGGRPYEVVAGFDLANMRELTSAEGVKYPPVEEPRNVAVTLPLGLVGDPQAADRCPPSFLQETNGQSGCPNSSIVGTVTFDKNGTFRSTGVQVLATSPIYNLVPPAGYPAEFGFTFLNVPVYMYASVVRTAGGYGLRVASTGIPEEHIDGVTLAFYGNPAERARAGTASSAFFSNPTICTTEPLTARIEANSWEEPSRWVAAESTSYSTLTGCDALQFSPALQVTPETTQADTPSGYDVTLKVPQAPQTFGVPATPDLRDATLTLPRGVALSPSAADGLQGCQETAPGGIDIPRGEGRAGDAGEGEALGPDGLAHLTAGHCPEGSRIGTVQITTPLLPTPLAGHVFLASPRCGGETQPQCGEQSATNGELFGIYLEAEGEGVVIKLKGTVSANPTTGQLTAHFDENPQLPFSELKLHLDGGARAPLANPQTCGVATTTSNLSPWSGPETPDSTPFSSFSVSGCAPSIALGPSFDAGTVTPIGGAFSPFTLKFSRQDGEQNLGGVTVHTPPGLLGKISEVPLCGEPEASEGTCRATSRIGITNVGAGAGSHPFWLSGQVYLTGPYKGAPFGLSIVVPAKAGPFNLGNEVVRAAISVDPHSSALTVTSDPLPQIKDGVPFRLKTVNVTIDRADFMFNPTNCSRQSINGTIAGAMADGSAGTTAAVSTPFAAAGCKNLPFKPKFTVLTQAKTSKANGASLHVKVTSGPVQANIAKVKVDLPKQLPSRLTTLQKACPETTFNANPATCPDASIVGTATAVTPVLKNPLTGPAYLVSHAGAAFPDLVVLLQGDGVTLDLIGSTDIKKGITISSFNAVPDAPISTFDLVLPEGPHSALAAYGSLCRTVSKRERVTRKVRGRKVTRMRTVRTATPALLSMPTLITGQNGAVIKQVTRIAVSGCRGHISRRTTKARRTHSRHRR